MKTLLLTFITGLIIGGIIVYTWDVVDRKALHENDKLLEARTCLIQESLFGLIQDRFPDRELIKAECGGVE